MNTESNLGKVPQVTLIFWIIKIAATTLGETGGDAVSMSMELGYLVGTLLFSVLFLIMVTWQIRAVVVDFLDKPLDLGGLALSRYSATLVLFIFIIGCIVIFPQKAASKGEH